MSYDEDDYQRMLDVYENMYDSDGDMDYNEDMYDTDNDMDYDEEDQMDSF